MHRPRLGGAGRRRRRRLAAGFARRLRCPVEQTAARAAGFGQLAAAAAPTANPSAHEVRRRAAAGQAVREAPRPAQGRWGPGPPGACRAAVRSRPRQRSHRDTRRSSCPSRHPHQRPALWRRPSCDRVCVRWSAVPPGRRVATPPALQEEVRLAAAPRRPPSPRPPGPAPPPAAAPKAAHRVGPLAGRVAGRCCGRWAEPLLQGLRRSGPPSHRECCCYRRWQLTTVRRLAAGSAHRPLDAQARPLAVGSGAVVAASGAAQAAA
jgi:hypothetical protein